MVRAGERTGQGRNRTLPGDSEGTGGSFPQMTGAVSSRVVEGVLLDRRYAAGWGNAKDRTFSHGQMKDKGPNEENTQPVRFHQGAHVVTDYG
jgi:hypothetical protein